jgi:hypothetical protein
VYRSWTDVAEVTTVVVCNGEAGREGRPFTVPSGPVGERVAGKNYSACHHDYLYVGGWLLFRHQRNGTEDQGAGSTGFNVWNVDIAEFSLMSEVGSVTYCHLRWDAVQRRLYYTVVDKSDGLAGRSGTIVIQ